MIFNEAVAKGTLDYGIINTVHFEQTKSVPS